jgi:hypothetical protein
MTDIDPNAEPSTASLVRAALEQARQLAKAEVALARDEITRELRAMRIAVVAFGAALAAGVLGVAFLLIAFLLGTFPNLVPALVVGALLVGIAATLGVVGAMSLPKKPLGQTTERVENDLQWLKERIA